MQERVLGVMKALTLQYKEEVWKSLDTAGREGGFQHGGDDVDPAEWQEWWSGVVAYLA